MSNKIDENQSPEKKEIIQSINYKKPLKLKMDFSSNINPNNLSAYQKKKNNQNYVDIENILKNANKITLKKYSTNLDKKINYLKNKSAQKITGENNPSKYINYINNHKIKKFSSEKTDISQFQNIKTNKTKILEEIIKKNMPLNNNVYHKVTNRNMSFQLKKNSNEKTVKSPLESLRSKIIVKKASNIIKSQNEYSVLDYQKFKNIFLINNDSLSISTNTMIKNTNNTLMKFLYFLNNNEILHLVSVNREIRSSIIGCLVYKVKEKIMPDFARYYCKNTLFINDYNFMISSRIYKKHKLFIRYILSIRSKITKNNKKIINKRFKIGFVEYAKNKFNNNNNNQLQINKKEKIYTTYIFEIIDKIYQKNFWVFKENTSFHYDDNNKAYFNDIMQFRPGDNTVINISLISEVGIIDFDNIFWFKPKIEEIKEINTNKCEVEKMINEWNKLSLLNRCEIVKKNIDDLFSNNFIIKDIYYDDVGYFFFKVILKAYKVGICSGKNENLGIKIHILPINSNITNEIKKNGLVFDENNELSVNVGDKLVFYISQNKT